MAEVVAPVELPTGRQSYMNTATSSTPDIHDPNWIPVLDGVDFKFSAPFLDKELSPYTSASFSPFPTRPSSPRRRPSLSRDQAKVSSGPVSVLSELDANLPPRSSSATAKAKYMVQRPPSSHQRKKSDGTSSDGRETAGSDTTTDGGYTPNTMATTNLLQEQYYTLPEQPVPREEILPPTLPSSRRASGASTKKANAILPPTSKYNRKPVASITTTSARPPTRPSQPNTPLDSPRLSPLTSTTQYPLPNIQPLSPPQIPQFEPTSQVDLATRLQSAKSSASERRQRALHSHPSNVSLQGRSRPSSISEDIEELPRPPSIRHKSRKSTESRPVTPRSAVYDAQTPTPAPTTPLPDLPPQARRPSTKEGVTLKQLQIPAEAHITSPPIPQLSAAEQHVDMASFMTNNSTVIFRRFDDVHVKLLLCLQDEITLLERELLKTESPVTPQGEKPLQRTKVLRELRRVVAEYDHLFANWSQMQANKINKSTLRDLKQWLEKPTTSATAGLGKGAKEDLDWLENSKDLSCVTLGTPRKAPQEATDVKAGGLGLDGLWALFNCAGKRK